MANYEFKKTAHRMYIEKTINNRRFTRLCALMYSRQISDIQISKILNIELKFWILIKKGKAFCPEEIQFKLEEILGDEITFIFSGQYCDRILLEDFKRGDELEP